MAILHHRPDTKMHARRQHMTAPPVAQAHMVLVLAAFAKSHAATLAKGAAA